MFLDTRNRISNARENPFPKGRGLSLLVSYYAYGTFGNIYLRKTIL